MIAPSAPSTHPALSADRIDALRRFRGAPLLVKVVAETGSTNADLLAGLNGLTSPMVLAAEMQTAGRGRAGRAWHTAPGQALTFSLAWKFHLPVQSLVGLPLAVGVAIVAGLARFGVDARLKWPNDVLLDGRKLAGILIETAAANRMRNEIWAVIGIGLNMAVSEHVEARIGKPVASMLDLDRTHFDRNMVLAGLLDELLVALPQFENGGFSGFRQRWNALDAYAGQQVRIIDHDRILHEGISAGVDQGGCLLLDTQDGTVAVMAGDVSLRKQDGDSHAASG